ncbi:MAG: DUF2142 domain-containing protein [Lachnospiraceae bacterium]|nr:DUF2142 domain-containing protein [Lachnospiraceae bacterium]
MNKKLDKKKKYLLVWGLICLLFTAVGILKPVEQARSQGLEGANQANLRTKTEELTAEKLLTFEIELPTDTAEQLGFFFSGNDYEYEQESLRIMAYAGEVLIGGQEFLLKDMQSLHFLSIDLPMEELERKPERLTIQIRSNAQGKGPSVWFNETTLTPGTAILDGVTLDKSLVYNLVYMTKVHQYQKPMLIGIILFLSGLGVYAAGGFCRPERKKNNEKITWWILPSKKQILTLVCIVILAALLFFYLYDTRIRIAQNTTEKAPVLKANGETLLITEETATISQIVQPKEEQLTGLGVRFYLEDGAVLTDGIMHAFVTDLTLGQVLCETDIAASQFISGEYIGLLFRDSQTGVIDHAYRIDLAFSPELWDSGLAFMTSDEGICVNAYLYFNIFLKKFFFFMFLGVEAFLCVFWYITFVKKARLENVFLVTILFFGIIYNVMITPQMVPDEAKHIDMAYRYTNELLGYESLGDTKMLMRMDDALTKFTSSPSFRNYRNIYYGLFSGVQDAGMVEADVTSNIEGSRLLYAPAVLGMSIARLLGWGTVPMLLLARYLNLTVFALLVWFGMRMLPFGKMTLFVLALLPINMQQCTSFSHDAMVHGILFFYSCLCLKAIFSEERMNGQRMVLLELAALFLMYCKSGSYLPLCFLPLLIPAEHYGGKREKYTATGVLFGIPLLAFVMKNIQTVTGIVNTTAATSVVSTGDGTEYLTGYTLGYFLKDPLELIYMLVNTAFDKVGFYLESLIGYKLGWVEIETSILVVLLFSFLLFLSVCDSKEESIRVKGIERGWMLLLCLGCTGLILLGMLLSWTPMGHVSIEGVQGRYFLPFMLILLTACKNRLILLAYRIDRGIAAAVAAGQLLTLTYVIKFILMV